MIDEDRYHQDQHRQWEADHKHFHGKVSLAEEIPNAKPITKMTIDIQRLRNLTTGRLHTDIGCVYEDLAAITGEEGLMTHMLPRACRAVEPWLREHVTDPRFWNGEYDTSHTGEIVLPEPTAKDRKAMFERYAEMPNPLAGKDVLVVEI